MIANITKFADYTGRYELQVSGNDSANLDVIITEIEYDTLIDLMGFPIYKEFETGLTPPIASKWADLMDGVEYTDCNGYLNNWRGLKYMLIPFVWTAFVKSEQYNQSAVGFLQSKTENSEIAGDFQWKKKLHDFQNKAIERYREAYLFMFTNLTDYNDFTTFFKEKRFNQIISKSSIA